jgi:MFS family permease
LVLADLDADNRDAGPRQHGLVSALVSPQVWLLTIIQFCLTSANPTLGFWGPTIIEGLGVKDNMTIGLLFAVPNLIAVICLFVVSRNSDRTLERRYHSALPCLACAAGLVSIGVFVNRPIIAFAGLVLGTIGPVTAGASFWQFPPMLLAGTAAAGGIALINSIGSFSGWVAPFAIGWLKDQTGTTSSGLYVVAGLEMLAGVLILLFIPHRSHVQRGDQKSEIVLT